MRKEKGIGALFQKKLNSWTRLEKIAASYGFTSPGQIARLIQKNSPIKHIGIYNMHILRICYEANKKEWPNFKNVSFYKIIKENIEALDVLMGQDPRTIYYGSTWAKLRRAKDKNFKISNYPREYSKVIEHIRKRHNDLISKHGVKDFLSWYELNKKDDWLTFIDWIVKSLRTQKKGVTVVVNSKVLRDDNKLSTKGRGALETEDGLMTDFVISGDKEDHSGSKSIQTREASIRVQKAKIIKKKGTRRIVRA